LSSSLSEKIKNIVNNFMSEVCDSYRYLRASDADLVSCKSNLKGASSSYASIVKSEFSKVRVDQRSMFLGQRTLVMPKEENNSKYTSSCETREMLQKVLINLIRATRVSSITILIVQTKLLSDLYFSKISSFSVVVLIFIFVFLVNIFF